MYKMNITSFKVHTASRKPLPIPLRTKKKEFALPCLYTECETRKQTLRLESCKVAQIDLTKSTQTLIVNLADPTRFNMWLKKVYDIDRKYADVKLSRFQRAFGGMMNPHIRIWSFQDGKYSQVDTPVRPGDTVQCAFTARVSKNKVYFDLHRDIVLEKQHETKKFTYFSDEE